MLLFTFYLLEQTLNGGIQFQMFGSAVIKVIYQSFGKLTHCMMLDSSLNCIDRGGCNCENK